MASFVAIDFETADYKADSACAVGLVRVENSKVVDEFVSLIRPPRSQVHFSHIHGLKWEDLQHAPTFIEVWPQMNAFMNGVDFLVAHNSSFDKRVLYACCQVAGVIPPPQPFQCTVQISRKTLKIFPSKLSHVCEVLGIDLQHHEALSDARASAQIMLHAERANGS